MSTQNVLQFRTFDLIEDNYESIKNYIENVFDDGNLSETESDSSYDEESCHEKVCFKPKTTELENVAYGVNDANFSSPINNVSKSSQKLLSLSNNKVKFSLKNITLPLIKQLQTSVESNFQSLITSQSHSVNENATKSSNKENESVTREKLNFISQKVGTDWVRRSDCSSGGESFSSSSSSKLGSSNTKSCKRKIHSPQKSSKKFKDNHSSEIQKSFKIQTKVSSDLSFRELGKDMTEFEKSKNLSCDNKETISSSNQFKCDFKNLESVYKQMNSNDYINMDSITTSDINKDGDEQLLADKIIVPDISINIVHKNAEIISKFSNEHIGNIVHEHHVHEDSSSSKEIIEDYSLEQNETFVDKALDTSPHDLWDIDPLLINSIPTDKDILISQETAAEFRKSVFSRFKLTDDSSSDKNFLDDSFDDHQILLANLENYDSDVSDRICKDMMLLKKAVESLKSFSDISFCCSLLLKRSQKLRFKLDPEFCNPNMKMFVDKLRHLVETQFESEEDYEQSRSITRYKFDAGLTNEPSSINDSQYWNNPDELQLVKQQIKAVLNPAILNKDISKEDYEEIVKLVVFEVGKHKKLHGFDCISFLEKSLQAAKKNKLM